MASAARRFISATREEKGLMDSVTREKEVGESGERAKVIWKPGRPRCKTRRVSEMMRVGVRKHGAGQEMGGKVCTRGRG